MVRKLNQSLMSFLLPELSCSDSERNGSIWSKSESTARDLSSWAFRSWICALTLSRWLRYGIPTLPLAVFSIYWKYYLYSPEMQEDMVSPLDSTLLESCAHPSYCIQFYWDNSSNGRTLVSKTIGYGLNPPSPACMWSINKLLTPALFIHHDWTSVMARIYPKNRFLWELRLDPRQ